MPLFGPPNVEKLKSKHNVKGLIKALGYKKDPSVRGNAADALVEMGAPAVAPLIAAFDRSKLEGCQDITEILAKIGEPAVEPLITYLEERRLAPIHGILRLETPPLAVGRKAGPPKAETEALLR